MAVRRILAIDGGGVRGLVAAIVLEALEDAVRRVGAADRLSDCFDLIAGTSSGAILAAALATPAPDGGSPPSPKQLREGFEANAARIFPAKAFLSVPVIGRLPQLFGPLYQPDGLTAVLTEQFGDMVFASARRNLLIPAYSIDPREILLFRGGPICIERNDAARYEMVKIRDAVQASASAPTFFPPHMIETPGGDGPWTAVDGGIFVNDPAMTAAAEASRLFPGDEFQIVSIGTGRQTRNYPYEKARRWGFSEWISPTGRFRTPLLSAIQDGQARAVNRQLTYLLGDAYTRFDYTLLRGKGSDKLDDASKRNLSRLTAGALQMIEDMSREIDALARELKPVDGA